MAARSLAAASSCPRCVARPAPLTPQVQPKAAVAVAGLRRGDEILEANGVDFSSILQRSAAFVLLQSPALVLTVRYNPAGALPPPRAHCRPV